MNRWVALLLGLTAFSLLSSVVRGQDFFSRPRTAASLVLPTGRGPASVAPVATLDARRTRELVCTLSAFFSIDPDDSRTGSKTIDGRGLVTCQNDQGFSSEFPVTADLEADIPGSLVKQGEISFSGNTEPFVVPREASQIQDSFRAQKHSWLQPTDEGTNALLFRGERNNLAMEMKLTSKTASLSGLNVTGLRLHFDDQAPDLF